MWTNGNRTHTLWTEHLYGYQRLKIIVCWSFLISEGVLLAELLTSHHHKSKTGHNASSKTKLDFLR